MNYDINEYCEELQKEIKDGIEFESIDYDACRKIILEHHYDDLISEMEFTDIVDNSTRNRDSAIVYMAKFLFLDDEHSKYEAMDYVSNLVNDAVKTMVNEVSENYKDSLECDEESDDDRLRDFNRLEAAAINAEL